MQSFTRIENFELRKTGISATLTERGVKLSGKYVFVIGFDNIPQSTIVSPELSTIHAEKEQMGAVAVRRLGEIIAEHQIN